MKYHTITIENVREKETIYTYLKEAGFSENYISNLRKQKENILLNNAPATTRARLKVGDELKLNTNPNEKTNILACNIPLDIVFEDDFILVANKPSGLSTMPNRSHYTNNLAGAVVNYMSKKDPNFVLRIINRLDKDTQGLVMVCKNAVVYKELLESVKKKYHAIVEGDVKEAVTIHLPIKEVLNEDGLNHFKRMVGEDGKDAITYVTPLKRLKNHTLCEMELKFGRTHQIRVHLSHIGHPLLADYIYGSESKFLAHTALVCNKMEFLHPVSKKVIKLEVEYGDGFKKALELLK